MVFELTSEQIATLALLLQLDARECRDRAIYSLHFDDNEGQVINFASARRSDELRKTLDAMLEASLENPTEHVLRLSRAEEEWKFNFETFPPVA